MELPAQPATITPYTPIEVIAMMNNSDASILASTMVSVNGITAQAASAGMMDSTGATRNSPLLDLVGRMISFISSFTPSARGCSSPFGPTRLGPIRICM
ncbi:hypothetical protein D3C72_1752500 [compost metagenome]